MRRGRPRPGLVSLWLLAHVAGCHASPASQPVAFRPSSPGLEVASLEGPEGAPVWALRWDPDRFALSVAWSPSGLSVPGGIPPGWVAVGNGGYFEQDLRPSGLLIVDGRQIAAASGGSGALVLDGAGRPSLVRLHEARPGADGSVLQLWPFLIEPGGRDGIHHDDQRRSRRSAIGLDARGRGLWVVVPRGGVSLYELMGICQKLGAVVAANLDGGPSTGFALATPPLWRTPSETPVANALVLRARAARPSGRASP